MSLRSVLVFAMLWPLAGSARPSAAQDAPASTGAGTGKQAPALTRYLSALRDKRLLDQGTARVEELRAMLAKAENLALAGRHEDAVVLLYELVESPRFSDYAELEENSAARFALGSSLHALGAEQSARRYLRSVIERGPEDRYFAPAFRAHSDVALSGLPLAPITQDLQALTFTLPEDAENELRYLRARERFDAGDDVAAERSLAELSERSRFHGSAQYLLGAIASRAQRWRDAEQRFCKVATAGDTGRYSFYVDGRYFAVKDLARLGLGRVAHEERRSNDAFYYYFQVPQDSPRLPEAMFEAAYATYEGDDHDNALDLLDQLEARFPRSAFADEASILRGYAALSGCEFEKARKMFTKFIERFTPVADEIDRTLDNPERRSAVYQSLVRSEHAPVQTAEPMRTVLELIRVDPLFRDLHARVEQLDAEAARSGRVADGMATIAARLSGGDAPKPTVAAGDSAAPTRAEELASMKDQLAFARASLRVLGAQLDAMRSEGAPRKELGPIEKDLAKLGRRASELEGRLADLRFTDAVAAPAPDASAAASQLFEQDVSYARDFERRAAVLRPKLVAQANGRAREALVVLRDRLRAFLRRARIGRIDAIMGSKRRIEMQIESLSAGRIPAGLESPLRVQGFLADDEEFWPFEGEDWPDEYIENHPGEK